MAHMLETLLGPKCGRAEDGPADAWTRAEGLGIRAQGLGFRV